MEYIPEISSTWFEQLGILTLLTEGPDVKERRVAQLMKFGLEVDAIMSIGWWEHTGDWDPFFRITLNDDTVIETESGYSSFEIGDTEGTKLPEGAIHPNMEQCTHLLVDDSEDDNDLIRKIDISTIKSILLER